MRKKKEEEIEEEEVETDDDTDINDDDDDLDNETNTSKKKKPKKMTTPEHWKPQKPSIKKVECNEKSFQDKLSLNMIWKETQHQKSRSL